MLQAGVCEVVTTFLYAMIVAAAVTPSRASVIRAVGSRPPDVEAHACTPMVCGGAFMPSTRIAGDEAEKPKRFFFRSIDE